MMQAQCERTATVPQAKAPAEAWRDYFLANRERLLELPWSDGAQWQDHERRGLAASLLEFQLGEQSEGVNLQRLAEDAAEAENDPAYAEAMTLFIAEEQRHAADLGRFLLLAGLPLLERSPLDRPFRWLRRRAGLPLMLTVLMTAEVIGLVYYRAVRRATTSPLLTRICDQFCRDELQHLRFHAQRLGRMRARRGALSRLLGRLLHWSLVAGTMAAVWCRHRQALRAGGLGMVSFARDCAHTLRRILHEA